MILGEWKGIQMISKCYSLQEMSCKRIVQVKRLKYRLYIQKTNETLVGVFFDILAFVETDRGAVEMIYDEGFRGEKSLSRATQFLTSNLGISALVLRSIISLREKLE